jgi:hypothetical protein
MMCESQSRQPWQIAFADLKQKMPEILTFLWQKFEQKHGRPFEHGDLETLGELLDEPGVQMTLPEFFEHTLAAAFDIHKDDFKSEFGRTLAKVY